MRIFTKANRRQVLVGLAGAGLVEPAFGQAESLLPDSDADQSMALQTALHAATGSGHLRLPAGRFRVSGIRFPGNLVVEGVPGATWLVANGASVGAASGIANLVLRDIGFAGDSGEAVLYSIEASQAITVERCSFRDSPATALGIFASGATIRDCDFAGHGDAAIHALDNEGVLITGNRITNCGNAGIRVWQSESGPDGTIVTHNRISDIDWRGGGNGQNGNGINVFLADEVIVADNHITDCAFTAIRLNTTRNSIVSGNQCFNSGEVAIFSEFGFSGSIIAQNIVDGAAGGISITNMDTGGEVAVCTGNIVRNITPRSEVNPDTSPFGIYAEADVAVSGNMVENVPGVGIGAGWGPYLRNVAVTGNVVTTSRIGIGASVADGAGAVTVSGNQVADCDYAIAGMAWHDVAEPDLLAVIDKYPHVTIR
jgi:uncharacterized secreted repeat protein (TIGR03808 family)